MGSRFGALGEVSGVELGEDGREAAVALVGAERTASRVAGVVLDDEQREWSTVVRRPRKSQGQIIQEFWEDAGYLTPSSRFWERRSPAEASDPSGKSLSPVCRSPVAGDGRSGGSAQRSSSPQSFVLGKEKVGLGWRGPLPRPRLTPPP